MTITRVKLENFTVFESLDLEPSPGINVLVGANGTGKTHLLKVCYAACSLIPLTLEPLILEPLQLKLLQVFLPSGNSHERLIRRASEIEAASIEIHSGGSCRKVILPRTSKNADPPVSAATVDLPDAHEQCVYIPVKDMLANAPGFRSLYAAREVHFEVVYPDLLDKAYLPALRNPAANVPQHLLDKLEAEIGGKVTVKSEEFFLTDELGDLEFTLLAEGLRKLGLLWLLIRNGTLKRGAVLFWDEPETNLNPELYGVVIEVLLELQRLGVQVFLATHDYVILKEIDLQAKDGDKVAFHSLYRSEEDGEIACQTSGSYSGIHPNAIADTFSSIYDRDVRRTLEGIVK